MNWAFPTASAQIEAELVTQQPIVEAQTQANPQLPVGTAPTNAVILVLPDYSLLLSFPTIFIPDGKPSQSGNMSVRTMQNGTNGYRIIFTFPGTSPRALYIYIYIYVQSINFCSFTAQGLMVVFSTIPISLYWSLQATAITEMAVAPICFSWKSCCPYSLDLLLWLLSSSFWRLLLSGLT